MPYIAPSTKNARLWVDAASKSLKIEKSIAADMYSRLCGFKNWDQVVWEIGRGETSPTDEMVTKDILEARKHFYCDLLVDEFGMNESLAEHIADRLSPSSGRKAKRISIDTDALFNNDPEPGIDLHQMFKSMGLDNEKDIQGAIEKLMKDKLGDSVSDDFNFENIAERLRISKPVDPGAWFDLLASIEWDLVEESFRSEYVYGEESFFAVKDGVEVPVFITSLVRAPFDYDDAMANHVMAKVEDFAIEELESDEALLFWGQPTIKKINGKEYSHFGAYYTDGQWHEFLINKDTTISNVFDQHSAMESVDTPLESLCDKNGMLALAAIKVINHIDSKERVSFTKVGTKSGWNSLIPGDMVPPGFG